MVDAIVDESIVEGCGEESMQVGGIVQIVETTVGGCIGIAVSWTLRFSKLHSSIAYQLKASYELIEQCTCSVRVRKSTRKVDKLRVSCELSRRRREDAELFLVAYDFQSYIDQLRSD